MKKKTAILLVGALALTAVLSGCGKNKEATEAANESVESEDPEGKAKNSDDAEEEEKEEAKKIAEKLSKILLKIPVKAGENGKIFGGVSAKEVSDLLKEEYKIEVDKKKIELKETIKTLGVRTLTIKLYEGVIGNLKIDVISK